MSSQINSASGASLGLGTSGMPMNLAGLATGLDTNAIVSELIQIASVPMVQLQTQQAAYNAHQASLQSIQTSLQGLATTAMGLSSPALFATSQSVSSSQSSAVSGTTKGAGVGSYQLAVTGLATPAQATYSFTSPASADAITIDGYTSNVAAGASTSDVAAAINNDPNAKVYAAALDGSTLVFSSRATGSTSSVSVSDTQSAFGAPTNVVAGQDAQYTLNGNPMTSSSNTVTNAIPGVTLNFQALTSGPATISVAAPAPNASTIVSQVQSFVSQYNSIVASINNQISTKPSATSPGSIQASLFGDSDLTSFLNQMRQAMYAPVAGLPSTLNSLTQIGISTGGPSGATSDAAVQGQLTVDSNALTNAIQNNPQGVQKLLQQFANSFQNLANQESGPGGDLGNRIQDDQRQSTNLGNQIANMQQMLTLHQQSLIQEYAKLEATVSQSQSTQLWLSQQIAAGF
jgi:flagellar hook-associated protein 2